jgi:hypothetical protein
MSEHESHGHDGYEKTDAHAGDTYRAGLYILGTMVLTALVVVPMYRYLAGREAREQRPATSLLKPDASAPPAAFPRLVASEPAVLAEFRAQEDALLTSYGWVEKDEALARMPIDAAMKIVAERGLPTFPAPAPSPAPAGGAQ